MTSEAPQVDREWRDRSLSAIRDGSAEDAARALLALTLDDPEGRWVEDILVECFEGDRTNDVRLLALTCFGHLARIHGALEGPRSVPLVQRMAVTPGFEGRARDALDDIEMFTRRSSA